MRPLLILFLLLSVMPPSTGTTIEVPRNPGLPREIKKLFSDGQRDEVLEKTVEILVAPPWSQTCERWHLWDFARKEGFRDDLVAGLLKEGEEIVVARALREGGAFQRARAIYQKVLAEEPTSLEARFGLLVMQPFEEQDFGAVWDRFEAQEIIDFHNSRIQDLQVSVWMRGLMYDSRVEMVWLGIVSEGLRRRESIGWLAGYIMFRPKKMRVFGHQYYLPFARRYDGEAKGIPFRAEHRKRLEEYFKEMLNNPEYAREGFKWIYLARKNWDIPDGLLVLVAEVALKAAYQNANALDEMKSIFRWPLDPGNYWAGSNLSPEEFLASQGKLATFLDENILLLLEKTQKGRHESLVFAKALVKSGNPFIKILDEGSPKRRGGEGAQNPSTCGGCVMQ
jgi:hypothetical protein